MLTVGRGKGTSGLGSICWVVTVAQRSERECWVFRRSCEVGAAGEPERSPAPAPPRTRWPEAPRGRPAPRTHLTFLPSPLGSGPLARRAGSKLEYLRFLGRPGPRLAGLLELSSLLGATGGAV